MDDNAHLTTACDRSRCAPTTHAFSTYAAVRGSILFVTRPFRVLQKVRPENYHLKTVRTVEIKLKQN